MMKPLRAQPKEEKGLSNWVLNSLREAILSGRFEPGEKLDHEEIASQLDVSRTPIREALKVLETEGFVEIRPYKGVYLTDVTQQDIHDVYEVRWIIECEIIRQATNLISEESLQEMEKLLRSKKYDNKSWGEGWYHEVDKLFHGIIAENCNNTLFSEIIERLNNRILRVRSFAMRQHGTHIEISHQEHLDILDAMKRRNSDEAAKLMEIHLKNSASRIEKYIK